MQTPRYRWIVLAMAFLSVFGALGLGRFGYSAVLPSMQEALGLSSAAAGSLASWNLVGYTVMAAVGGVLASRLGPRVVLTAGLFITAAGMFLTGLTSGLLGASAARLLTGMGNGMILVPAIALMVAWFDVRRVGLASAIVPTGSSLAMVLAGPLVPRLIAAGGDEGWRLAWYFFAAITLALALLNAGVQRDRPRRPPPGRGALYGRRAAYLQSHRDTTAADLLGILRAGYAWHLGMVYFLYGVGFLSYFTFFQKRLTGDLGYSAETAGNLFLIMGVAGLVGGFFWGALSDRIGRRWTIVVMLGLAGIAGLLFAWAPGTFCLGLSGVLLGSTCLVIPGLIGAACGDRFGAVLASASLGFVTVLVGVGQSVGPYVGGLLGDVFGSLWPTYLMSGLVFLLGAAGMALLPDARILCMAAPDPGAAATQRLPATGSGGSGHSSS